MVCGIAIPSACAVLRRSVSSIERPIEPPSATGLDDLRHVATARLVLDNVPHIKAYWVMVTPKLAQVALSFGADDLDGTVVEEKIYHDAGASTPQSMTRQDILRLIREAGSLAELARVLCVVNCQLAADHPPLLAWFEACVHFSDVVFFTNSAGVPGSSTTSLRLFSSVIQTVPSRAQMVLPAPSVSLRVCPRPSRWT